MAKIIGYGEDALTLWGIIDKVKFRVCLSLNLTAGKLWGTRQGRRLSTREGNRQSPNCPALNRRIAICRNTMLYAKYCIVKLRILL